MEEEKYIKVSRWKYNFYKGATVLSLMSVFLMLYHGIDLITWLRTVLLGIPITIFIICATGLVEVRLSEEKRRLVLMIMVGCVLLFGLMAFLGVYDF